MLCVDVLCVWQWHLGRESASPVWGASRSRKVPAAARLLGTRISELTVVLLSRDLDAGRKGGGERICNYW